MTLVDLLTYRGTLILLNGCVLLGAVAVLVATGQVPPLLIAPSLLGALAFATPRRHKLLLALAVAANLLLLLVSLPFTFFSVTSGIGAAWFIVLALATFATPVLTIFACWARWPRRAAI